MKNNLYPQLHQTLNGSFDDYDSVIGNEFSVNGNSAKNSGGEGGSNYSDGMSSLGNSHLGLHSAANSPVRIMNMTSAAAASANPQPWRQQQRTPMTPMSDESSDSNGLEVGDVSVVLGNTGRTPAIGDVESVGGDSLFMISPPVRQTAHLERDAAEWNPQPTAETSKYLQLGPLGDQLSFGGDNSAYDNYPTFNDELDLNADTDSDEEDDDAFIGFLPQGRFGNCIMISSTILVVGALVISVVAILNLTSVLNNPNNSPKLNIDAAGGGVNDVIIATLAPIVPLSTITPTVPATTTSPTTEPTFVTDSPTKMPTSEPTFVTDSPTAMPIALVLNETDSPVSSNSTAATSEQPASDEPTPSPISSAPSKEPTTDTPTNVPTVTTPSPTSSAPSNELTTDTPTNVPTVVTLPPTSSAPSNALTTDESTAAPDPTASEIQVGSFNTTGPSKSPTTEDPTVSFQPTLSPTKQTLLTVGTGAFTKKDIHFYLVSDDLYVRQYWRNKFEKLGDSRSRFLFHLGSATPASEDCPEEAYARTEKSLSFSRLRAFAVPGNRDYPNCPDPSLAWKNYTEHLVNIDKKYWTSTSKFQIKRDPEQPENFAFIFRRTLFVGLNMVSNEGKSKTATRLEQNLQWASANVQPHKNNIDVIFLMGHGRLEDLPTFRDAIVAKTKGGWKNKLIIYARRAKQTKLVMNVQGAKNFHELTVGSGYPITGVHLDMTTKNAPRVGYRYSDGSPITDVDV